MNLSFARSTRCACTVNDRNEPLIDGIIKSGKDSEYRTSIFLIAGRPYSIPA